MGEVGVTYHQRTRGRAVKGAQKRSMVGVTGNLALIQFQQNNKQDYKQELKKKLRKDGEMGKVPMGGTEGPL